MKQGLKEKMLKGRIPVTELEMVYVHLSSSDQVKEADKHCCEMEEATHVADWFECPGCEKITFVLVEFDPGENVFKEIEKVENKTKYIKCIHCGLEFTTKEYSFVHVKNGE